MHPVVADFQIGDAGLLAFARFKIGQKAVGVVAETAVLVQLGVEAIGNHPAVAQHHRRLRLGRPTEQIGLIVMAVQRGAELAHPWRIE